MSHHTPQPDPYSPHNQGATTPGGSAGFATHGFETQPVGEPRPGTDLGNDVSKSLGWTFSALVKNLGAFLVPALIWLVVTFVIVTAAFLIFIFASVSVGNASSGARGDGTVAAVGTLSILGTFAVGAIAAMLPVALWSTGVAEAAGMIARGEKPTIMNGLLSVRLIPIAVVFAILYVLGLMFFFLGSLIVLFFFGYSVYAASTDNLGVGAALKASARAALDKPVHAIVLVVVMQLVSSILSATVLGVVFAVPIMALLTTAMYLRVTNRAPSQARAS